MSRLVLLLRGINVGTAKQVGMADLRGLLEDAGHTAVRTYLRSGNVVLDATAAPDAVARDAAARIGARFGFPVAVLARTGDELDATLAADPLGDVAPDASRHVVAFLERAPSAELVAGLQAAEAAPERFAVVGREVHLWLPDGVTGSPLMRVLTPERAGGTVTARNWTTVTKLAALARAA